ncbi:MAG: hypothetical protein M3Q93_07820 [Gemmatimonadota bacterium]|nr:hypothetical protein [Gemmatimonadota bacterium]
MRAIEKRQRHDGARVDGYDRRLHLPPQCPRLARHDEGGEVVGDDERGAFREQDQGRARRASARARIEVESVLNAPGLEVGVEVDDRLEDEGVQPVAGPRVVDAEPMIDHDG